MIDLESDHYQQILYCSRNGQYQFQIAGFLNQCFLTITFKIDLVGAPAQNSQCVIWVFGNNLGLRVDLGILGIGGGGFGLGSLGAIWSYDIQSICFVSPVAEL